MVLPNEKNKSVFDVAMCVTFFFMWTFIHIFEVMLFLLLANSYRVKPLTILVLEDKSSRQVLFHDIFSFLYLPKSLVVFLYYKLGPGDKFDPRSIKCSPTTLSHSKRLSLLLSYIE